MTDIETLIPKELSKHIIGMWKFRASVGKPTWCITYLYRGKFYDTMGHVELSKALEVALKDLRKVKKRYGSA